MRLLTRGLVAVPRGALRGSPRSRPVALCLTAVWMLSGIHPDSSPAAPSLQAVPPVAGHCRAITYTGANGGERIQHAIDDPACSTVEVDGSGPDAGGDWFVSTAIVLKSNLTLEGAGSQAHLSAVGNMSGPGLLTAVNVTNVTIRSFALAGNAISPNGVWIQGSQNVLITQGTIAGGLFHGIHLTGTPSTDIRVSDMTFSNNGNVDVRTDTIDPSMYHSRILVTNNAMSGTAYGVALANCGEAPPTACEVRDNTITRVTVSGVDINRSHYAVVSGNRVSDCLNGLGVDDAQHATISNNTVEACRGDGILMANGAVETNRPWSVSNNQVNDNTLLNNAGFGLRLYAITSDPDSRNELNTWMNNRISGNTRGGCNTNAERNTFKGNGPQECPPQR